MTRENTLYYKIQHDGLNPNEKESLYGLVSSGCRKTNKDRLYRRIFQWGINHVYGIFERVSFNDSGNVSYCAGQSYPDEIRYLREAILDN